ncbi:MAG: 16S rRNA (guanine(527)-N(7))-methyltransferase RsmG [Nocardioides sp.]
MFSSESLPVAEAYAAWLADAGTVRGLIGPREVPRLWERHLLNCAVLAEVLEPGATVCDLGSGAGLPGLVLAIARPELRVTLVEPLLRRTTFLEEVVADPGLASVEVVRGRAEDLHGSRRFDAVTSRALAPLHRLVGWSMPLVATTGAMLAMKVSTAGSEIVAAGPVLRELGCAEPEIVELGGDVLPSPTIIVRVAGGEPGRVGWPLAPTAVRRPSRTRRQR